MGDKVDVMEKKLEVAAAIARKGDVIELLDKRLGSDDQAWVVCEYDDCLHFVQGHCSIYMVHNVPKMQPGKPCSSYEKRP